MTFNIILCDISTQLVLAWRKEFDQYHEVAIQEGSILNVEADAYVSPANGFGIMDGGIDAVLRRRFPNVDSKVQKIDC